MQKQATVLTILLLASFARVPGSPLAVGLDAPSRSVTKKVFHLGNNDKKEWSRFSTEKPHHRDQLELRFDARASSEQAVLRIVSGDVDSKWDVLVNGRKIGRLEKRKGDDPRSATPQFLAIPPGLLKSGENRFRLERGEKSGDDIWVGPIGVEHRSLAKALGLSELRVRVFGEDGKPLPCRISLTKAAKGGKKGEERVKFELSPDDRLAVRKGVVYSLDGSVDLPLVSGRYTVYATRGFEYGLAKAKVVVAKDSVEEVRMTLEREVDTTGWLAGDTHVHTFTHSGHGDSTVEERVVTIAGEGVEVAVATDHNHHTDYRPVERKVGVDGEFRSVIGNEFTTKVGHFNAFPIEESTKPANHDHEGWVKLLRTLRKTPGVRVVVCNHPRRKSYAKGPWGAMGVHPISGELPSGGDWLGVDAVEVLNGKNLVKKPEVNFQDWFRLLNRGHRLVAVAGSDSHTVDHPVGQCRSYIRSETDDPDRIDVRQVVDHILEGRVSLSMGLLAAVRVAGRYGIGDLASGLDEEIDVEITVTAPRWIRASEVSLYLNGEKVRSSTIEHDAAAVVKFRETWRIGRPNHDAHLVVIATGPPVDEKFWTYHEGDRYVIGGTNPVWLDADGDGKFTSARAYAEALVEKHGTESLALRDELRECDEAIAIQVASLVRERLQASLQVVYERLQTRANEQLRSLLSGERSGAAAGGGTELYSQYLESLPEIDVVTRRERRLAENERAAKKGKKRAAK